MFAGSPALFFPWEIGCPGLESRGKRKLMVKFLFAGPLEIHLWIPAGNLCRICPHVPLHMGENMGMRGRALQSAGGVSPLGDLLFGRFGGKMAFHLREFP